MSEPNFARELWRRLETIHAVAYFAPESVEVAADIGVRGFWRTYFGYRAAPLGACSAGPVVAAFFGFAPTMVERAVPAIWELASPAALIQARWSAAAAALRRLAPEELDDLLADEWALATLRIGAASGDPGGRPLYAANRPLDAPDDPAAALWQLTTALREHRGDGHVAAWTAAGIAPTEVAVLFVADGATTRESLQPNRGWTDDDWVAAESALEARGLLAGRNLTDGGRAMRAVVEATTDKLADEPFADLDPAGRGRLLDALTPIARAIGRSSTIPAANPMGVQVPD